MFQKNMKYGNRPYFILALLKLSLEFKIFVWNTIFLFLVNIILKIMMHTAVFGINKLPSVG